MKRRIAPFALALVLIGCGKPPDKDLSDRNYVKADAWLREHLHDPHHEKVRWWPARESPELRDFLVSYQQAHLESQRKVQAPEAEIKKQLAVIEAAKNMDVPVVARLRTRVKNQFGALRLTDYVFAFRPDGTLGVYSEDNKGEADQFDAAMAVFKD